MRETEWLEIELIFLVVMLYVVVVVVAFVLMDFPLQQLVGWGRWTISAVA